MHEQLDTDAILDMDHFLQYEPTVTKSNMIPWTLQLVDCDDRSICDIGGASGFFLNEIMKRSDRRVRAVNMDVNGSYREHLVNPEIQFLPESILVNTVPTDSFDIVTARHMLHHMVANTVAGTLALQKRALEEMFRITRPGGYVVIEEEVNRVRTFSWIIYRLSALASRWRIRSTFFQTGTVIVSFLTPEEIENILDEHRERFGLEIIESEYVPWPRPWRWRLTLLMSRVGHVLYAIKVTR